MIPNKQHPTEALADMNMFARVFVLLSLFVLASGRCEQQDLDRAYSGKDGGEWKCDQKADMSGEFPDGTVCDIVPVDKNKSTCDYDTKCKGGDWDNLGSHMRPCRRVSGDCPSIQFPGFRPPSPMDSWESIGIDCSQAVNFGDKCAIDIPAQTLGAFGECTGYVVCDLTGRFKQVDLKCGCKANVSPTSELGKCIQMKSYSGGVVMKPGTDCKADLADLRQLIPDPTKCSDNDLFVTCTRQLDFTCSSHPQLDFNPPDAPFLGLLKFSDCDGTQIGQPCPYTEMYGIKCVGEATVIAQDLLDVSKIYCGCNPDHVTARKSSYYRLGGDDLCDVTNDGFVSVNDKCGGIKPDFECEVATCTPEYTFTQRDIECTKLNIATIAPTTAPATNPPSTDAPATNPPPTNAPDTDAPPTDAPKTDAPATNAPDTLAPTDVPDTDAPMTNPPDTDAPATNPPPTDAPATLPPTTDIPDTLVPGKTTAPATDAPDTNPPATTAPATKAPDTDIPDTLVPGKTTAPATDAPDTDAPATTAPATKAPDTDIPDTLVPGTTEAPATDPPTTEVPNTVAPETDAPATSAPETDSPATDAPSTPEPVSGACDDACACKGLTCPSQEVCKVPATQQPFCGTVPEELDLCASVTCKARKTCAVVGGVAVCRRATTDTEPLSCKDPAKFIRYITTQSYLSYFSTNSECKTDTCAAGEECVPHPTCGVQCVTAKCKDFVWPPRDGVCRQTSDCSSGEVCPVSSSSMKGRVSQYCACDPLTGEPGQCSQSIFSDLRRCVPAKWDCSANNTAQATLSKDAKRKRDEWCCETLQTNCNIEDTTYHCEAVGTEGPETWSEEKRTDCCLSAKVGCIDKDMQYDCGSREQWSFAKRNFCCTSKGVGCPVAPYDCDGDATNWIASRRSYCCSTRSIGCNTAPTVFDCAKGGLWFEEKRDYCCSRHGVQCRDNKPLYDCWGSAISAWDDAQTQYCCATSSRGCKPTTSGEGPYSCVNLARAPENVRLWCCRYRSRGCKKTQQLEETCAMQPADTDTQEKCCSIEEKYCSYHCPLPDTFEEAATTQEQRDFCCKVKGIGCFTRNTQNATSDVSVFGEQKWRQFEVAYRGSWEDVEGNPRRYFSMMLATLEYALTVKFAKAHDFRFFIQLIGPIQLATNLTSGEVTPIFPDAGSEISKQAILIPKEWHDTADTSSKTTTSRSATILGLDSAAQQPSDRGLVVQFTMDGAEGHFEDAATALTMSVQEGREGAGSFATNNEGETFVVSPVGGLRTTGAASGLDAPEENEDSNSSILIVVLGCVGGVLLGGIAAGYMVVARRGRESDKLGGGLETELAEWQYNGTDSGQICNYNAATTEQGEEPRNVVETGTI